MGAAEAMPKPHLEQVQRFIGNTPEGQVECGGGTEVTVGLQDLKKQNPGLFAPHSSSPGLGLSAALWRKCCCMEPAASDRAGRGVCGIGRGPGEGWMDLGLGSSSGQARHCGLLGWSPPRLISLQRSLTPSVCEHWALPALPRCPPAI
ncbi:unnamed protein product [Gadus morhua 'NCC']